LTEQLRIPNLDPVLQGVIGDGGIPTSDIKYLTDLAAFEPRPSHAAGQTLAGKRFAPRTSTT
jgi:hypothetical protein